MIGKAEWFNLRKYGGWGLTPKSWQGWAYIVAIMAPLAGIQYLPLNGDLKFWVMILWSVIFAIDLIDIMRRIPQDEREQLHEALADRNALWFMILALVLGFAYKTAQSVAQGKAYVDPFFLVTILGAMIVKTITHWYLRDK